MTTITEETLRIMRLAMYQLRQDVGIPSTPEEAAADTSPTWTKCRELFDVAFHEVLAAHNWTWAASPAAAASPDAWPQDAKNALVYCAARELAVPVAGRVEDMKNLHQLYVAKLAQSRIRDLEAEVAAVSDPVTAQVLAMVCPSFTASPQALPMDLKAITRRIDSSAANAREEILLSHNWSFARAIAPACSTACPAAASSVYPHVAAIPAKCARVLECRGAGRADVEWKIVGREIFSSRPIEAILYVRDEERVERWPRSLADAYATLLAADIVSAIGASAAEAERLHQLYERRLASAKLADSRATSTAAASRGRNFYAAAMTRGGAFAAKGGRPWR